MGNSESRQENCCGDQCPSKIKVEKLKIQIENLNKLIKYLENDIKRQEQVIESLHKIQNNKNQFANDGGVAPQNEGLDFGTGAAHSFYHGYLKIVIPRSGTSYDKHLKELMQDYEDTHKIKFEFYKLFILVPNSLYCPTNLTEVSTSICESASLEEKKLTVAGVRDRSYKNSVYKIRLNEKFIYAVVEYATPIKTFRDALNYHGNHSDEDRKTIKDQVLDRFCSTLQKLLKENEECTDYCEIIRYDDRDKNDKSKDLAPILLTRFEELRRRERT